MTGLIAAQWGVVERAEACPTADTARALEGALASLEPNLKRFARRLTADADLADDLVQEARIRLWELDPTRFDLTERDQLRYVCRTLFNAVLAAAKREARRQAAGPAL